MFEQWKALFFDVPPIEMLNLLYKGTTTVTQVDNAFVWAQKRCVNKYSEYCK
jgi:hypothetical protein